MPNVAMWNGVEKKLPRTISLEESTLRTLVNIPRADPDSQLDFLEARWSFDEPANSPVFRVTGGFKAGQFDVYPRRWVQSGATGVSGTGLWFDEYSRAEFQNSKQMLPATGDFSVFFWIGFPEPSTSSQRTLLNTIDGGVNRFSIAINQDPEARTCYKLTCPCSPDAFTLVRPLAGGDYAVGIFNFAENEQQAGFPFRDLGLSARNNQRLHFYDCLSHQDLGTFTECFSAKVPAHGCRIYRVSLVPQLSVNQ